MFCTPCENLTAVYFTGISKQSCYNILFCPSLGERWGEWSAWSECSRTCDGGATYQERKCLDSYARSRSKASCDGERFRYNTCNIEPCAPDSVDFREQQCSAYNNATYGGKLYKWLPYTDRKNPCTLYCIPMGTRTVVRLAPEVLDGTRCKPKSYDMCISGKCWKVGCDHRLDSPLKLDLCSVCGGNNSCLNNGTKGRYHWIKIGLSACSASCGVGIQTYLYRCRDRLTGNQVPDSRCAILPKPNGKEKSCFRRQCPPVWKIFPWQECTVSCGGGIAKRAVRCMDTLRDGRQQWLHDSFCPYPKPSQTRPYPRYIARHDETGQQGLSLGYRKGRSDDYLIINENEIEKYRNEMRSPKFVVSDWGACSATCGEAYRTRFVRCQVFLPLLGDTVDMADSECYEDHKPKEKEPCSVKPCYKDFRWEKRGMTVCSRSCLGGTQETQLECVNRRDGKSYSSDHCQFAETVPIERRICNDVPCPQRWRIGDFGECSTTCGGGTMKREVHCTKQVDLALDRVVILPDVMCEQPVPLRARECNTQFCPANWASGIWSECSVSCGTGVELRPVVCQRVSPVGEPVDVDEDNCPPSERPHGERSCNRSACPEIRIKERPMKFIQINKIKKVRLNVGADAHVLHGTNLILKCPVRGMYKKRVEWLKDGNRIPWSRRVSFSPRGNLKIRKSSSQKDTGTYTCVAQKKKADVTIQFNNFMDVLQETIQREKYLLGFLADESSGNTTFTIKDPFDRQYRPLQLVVSNWSACSSTCGRAVQVRNVTCEIITHDYLEVFPLRVCKNAGIRIPDAQKKCDNPPCTKWFAKNWSKCLMHKCVREGHSMKSRTVICIKENTTSVVDSNLCDKSRRPFSKKECKNNQCKPVWHTSEWSECIAGCKEKGFQTRMLTCIWQGNQKSAGRSCENLARPVLTRSCFNNCTHGMWVPTIQEVVECVDASEYCNIVPQLKLCRFTNFKTKCCHSCSSVDEDPPS
ncbi:A disintegrin and metalloproteinase with thrombospondin motifs 16 [Plakobranchus ocellatus]|uniref:A disintegrin and metalloproteinase with thrombospondin motifs 16 n=1 Tax=Plakobranchus ocellatus TaxID=259542 RepID=A0AAV4B215_9GAST|nr:A disintegrin and metalloproteinase with thrombospondin motifs 16 [Plakobranchus ocellatus]